MRKKPNNYGNCWNSSLMCLFGIKESWDVINFENKSLMGKVFLFVEPFQVNFLFRKKMR
jgi:hypothetical protein